MIHLPRLARRLAAWRCRPDRRDERIGDLMELFAHRAERYGALYACCRSYVDALSLCLHDLRRVDVTTVAASAATLSSHRPRGDAFMQQLWNDIRYAVRGTRRRPAFSVAVVLSLALAIGVTTAMFSVVHGVLLRPLAYPNPDGLVMAWMKFLPASGYDFPQMPLSGPEYLDYREQTRLLDVGAFRPLTATVGYPSGDPERMAVVIATPEVFQILGVRPEVGRLLTSSDGERDASCVVVLSHGLAVDRFGDAGSALDNPLRLDGRTCTVVGVMPAGFAFPDRQVRLWTAYWVNPDESARYSHNTMVVGRLRPGATRDQAARELDVLMPQWSRSDQHYAVGHLLYLTPLHEYLVGEIGQPLLLLLGAVGVILAIVCANLASLLFARGHARRHELAVRLALGARRGVLVRQLVVEVLVLATAGGALGITLAVLGFDAMIAAYPGELPRREELGISLAVPLFGMAITIAVGLFVGLLPALRMTAADLLARMRSEGRTSQGVSSVRIQRVLVTGELALSVALLFGATLLVQSLFRLQEVRTGIQPDRVSAASIAVPAAAYAEASQARGFYDALLERLSSMPGVSSVGAASFLPMDNRGAWDDFTIVGRGPAPPGAPATNAAYAMATPGFFDTLGVELVRGRLFDARDVRGQPDVALVSEVTAARFWPGEDPIGARITYSGFDTVITVVGIVSDVRAEDLREDVRPTIYTPLAQAPRERGYPGRDMYVFVRTQGDTSFPLSAMQAAIRELNSGVAPPDALRSMNDLVARATARPRFTTWLMVLFAGAAVVLAAVGVYGIVSFGVVQRTREIGVRMALGARTGDVLWLVVAEVLGMTVAGGVLGLGAAFVLARGLGGLLYAVSPSDPWSLIGVTLALFAAALIAGLVPARRASRISPLVAMRAE